MLWLCLSNGFGYAFTFDWCECPLKIERKRPISFRIYCHHYTGPCAPFSWDTFMHQIISMQMANLIRWCESLIHVFHLMNCVLVALKIIQTYIRFEHDRTSLMMYLIASFEWATRFNIDHYHPQYYWWVTICIFDCSIWFLHKIYNCRIIILILSIFFMESYLLSYV